MYKIKTTPINKMNIIEFYGQIEPLSQSAIYSHSSLENNIVFLQKSH